MIRFVFGSQAHIPFILIEKGKNHFEVLPEGWLQVTHNSGLPIYMHKVSRVCSVSRPYFLGPGSLRKHQIPVSAIPCLSYRRALEEEKKLRENVENEKIDETNGEQSNAAPSGCPYANGGNSNGTEHTESTSNDVKSNESEEKPPPAKKPRAFGAFSNAKIETVKENLKEQSLTVQQINDYCRNLFIFKNIRVMRFT